MKNVIVVLCRSHMEASDAFDMFVDCLDNMYPLDSSVMIDEYANLVETYHGLRYIFCDENMRDVYTSVSDDFIFVDDFLEDMIPDSCDSFG